MYGANVIIFEGIMTFCNKELTKVSLQFYFFREILEWQLFLLFKEEKARNVLS